MQWTNVRASPTVIAAVRDVATHSHPSGAAGSRRSCRSLSALEKGINSARSNMWIRAGRCAAVPRGARRTPCVTHALSSVSLLAEGSDGSGGSGGAASSGGAGGTGVSSLSLQEEHKAMTRLLHTDGPARLWSHCVLRWSFIRGPRLSP